MARIMVVFIAAPILRPRCSSGAQAVVEWGAQLQVSISKTARWTNVLPGKMKPRRTGPLIFKKGPFSLISGIE
jgi:hypothetical protein